MRLMSIASGSSGNCIYMGSAQGNILIDAGISGKKIEAGLAKADVSPADLDGICITHEHIDHVQGLGVMARRYHLPIYTTRGTWESIRRMSSLGEIPEELFREIVPEQTFTIKDMEVQPVHISHDAADPVAYLAHSGKAAMGVVTDLGVYDAHLVEALRGMDVLVLESNHDIRMLETGIYPYHLKRRILGDRGHLSNESCGRLLASLLHDDFKAVLLGHLSKENNLEELAYETVRAEVTMSEVPYTGDDFPIQIAHRDRPSDIFEA